MMVMCTPDLHAGAERDLYIWGQQASAGGRGRLGLLVNVCAACRVRAPVKSCVFMHLRPSDAAALLQTAAVSCFFQ